MKLLIQEASATGPESGSTAAYLVLKEKQRYTVDGTNPEILHQVIGGKHPIIKKGLEKPYGDAGFRWPTVS